MYLPFIVVCIVSFWLIFLGGADQLENSWLTAFLHVPGMTSSEIKVWAIVSVGVSGVATLVLSMSH